MLELTVLDDNGDKTPSVLGKVAIPLLSVSATPPRAREEASSGGGAQHVFILARFGRCLSETVPLVLALGPERPEDLQAAEEGVAGNHGEGKHHAGDGSPVQPGRRP